MHDRLAAAESRRAAFLQNMEALAQVLEDGEKGGERRQLERSLRGVSEALGALQAARPAPAELEAHRQAAGAEPALRQQAAAHAASPRAEWPVAPSGDEDELPDASAWRKQEQTEMRAELELSRSGRV